MSKIRVPCVLKVVGLLRRNPIEFGKKSVPIMYKKSFTDYFVNLLIDVGNVTQTHKNTVYGLVSNI